MLPLMKVSSGNHHVIWRVHLSKYRVDGVILPCNLTTRQVKNVITCNNTLYILFHSLNTSICIYAILLSSVITLHFIISCACLIYLLLYMTACLYIYLYLAVYACCPQTPPGTEKRRCETNYIHHYPYIIVLFFHSQLFNKHGIYVTRRWNNTYIQEIFKV